MAWMLVYVHSSELPPGGIVEWIYALLFAAAFHEVPAIHRHNGTTQIPGARSLILPPPDLRRSPNAAARYVQYYFIVGSGPDDVVV